MCRPNQPNQWRHTQQDRLKRGAVLKVIADLAEYLEPETTPDENPRFAKAIAI